MYIKELTNEEFNNFTLNFKDKSIYQTSEYAFVMNKQNFDSVFVGLIDNDKIVAASLILIEKRYGFKYAYAPRGFLINYNDIEILKTFTSLIKKYLSKLDVIAIKISPIIYKEIIYKDKTIYKNEKFEEILKNLKKLGFYHLGFNNSFEALKPRFEAIINLKDKIKDTFNNLPKSLKTKIRSAEKNGIIVHKGNLNNLNYLYLQTKKKYPRDLSYFKDCYEFFNRHKTAEFYYAKMDTSIYLNAVRKEYEQELELNTKVNDELFSKRKNKTLEKKMELDKKLNDIKNVLIEATKLNREFPNGIIMASVLIVKNDDTAHMLIDGYDPKYKKFNGKHLLIWKLIEKFSKQGITKFNLGGINNPNNPISKYKGLTDFKLNFNADVYEYIGDLELITNKALYFMYRNSAPIRKILKK